jgi:hypothetical protein
MTRYSINKAKTFIAAGFMLASLAACDHNDDGAPGKDSNATFEINVTNATNAQPMTPIAVVAHTSTYHPWILGSAASTGLEMLAESGDVAQFLSDAEADSDVKGTVSSSDGPFGPGTTESVKLKVKKPDSDLNISVASMLADTNDAFTGVANVPVGMLNKGDSLTMMARVYDAGTESNSETAATIPGPAGGGEGFNATRDDTNFVSIHAGVVTADDGLSTSALGEKDRWLGPAAKITITRTN